MFVHDGICKFLNRLPEVTLSLKMDFEKEFQSNESLRRRTEKRIELINQTGNDRLMELFKEANLVVEKAFIANIGVWFIYLVPIALCLASINKLSEISKELVAMPTRETENLIPIQK